MTETRKRDFLKISDLSAVELTELLALASQIKSGSWNEQPLAGKSLAMIFAKSSTRTRVSFEIATLRLGGWPLFLSSRDIQLGRGEPIRDTARVLSSYVDGIMIRTFAQADVEELAEFATVPVINGLTDLRHPCQLLADLLTMQEEFGSLSDRTVAWIGDGNNMANSWMEAAGLLGFTLRLACPEGYEPDHAIYRDNSTRTSIMVTPDPDEAASSADVIVTDVWASMGQEDESESRRVAFSGYLVDADLLEHAAADAIVLHCLPAHRGEEISQEVLEGPRSRIFVEAANRLPVQQALLARLMS